MFVLRCKIHLTFRLQCEEWETLEILKAFETLSFHRLSRRRNSPCHRFILRMKREKRKKSEQSATSNLKRITLNLIKKVLPSPPSYCVSLSIFEEQNFLQKIAQEVGGDGADRAIVGRHKKCAIILYFLPSPGLFHQPIRIHFEIDWIFHFSLRSECERNVCRGAKSGGENRDKIRFLSFQLSLNLPEDFLMQKDRFEQTQKASIRLNIVYAP